MCQTRNGIDRAFDSGEEQSKEHCKEFETDIYRIISQKNKIFDSDLDWLGFQPCLTYSIDFNYDIRVERVLICNAFRFLKTR